MNKKQILALILSFNLISNNILLASSIQIDTTASSKYQASLDSAANGVKIVNIVNPNSKGTSHNKFSNYNVEKSGLILNNSKTVVNTQLAGYISFNPNLNTNAKLILNEVTGTNRSLLSGYSEIAGIRADVIVANPNGITVNGGGFINTNRAVLTTGVPSIQNGFLNGFDVTRGNILIEEAGFNTTNIDKVELYSKALAINAKFYANNLKIATGDNFVDVNGVVTSNEKVDSGISIDSSALGGIYANRIELISNDKGVGVNLPPEVFAQDSLMLSANGNIVLKDVLANNSIDINSTSITANNSTVSSQDRLTINSSIINNNDSNFIAKNDLTIDTSDFTNNSLLKSSKELTLNISDGNLTNKGVITALNGDGITKIKITNGNITNENLIGGYDLQIDANDISNNGALYSKNSMKINAKNLDNFETIRSNKEIELFIENSLNNKQNAIIYSDDNLTLAKNENHDKTNSIINNSIIQSEKEINIYAKTLENSASLPTIISNTSSTTKKIGTGNDYDLITTITTNQTIDINKINPALILANEDINIDVETLNNIYSLIASNKDIKLNANEVNNIGKVLITTTKIVTNKYRNEKYCSTGGPSGSCLNHKNRAAYRGTSTSTQTNNTPTVNFGIQAKDSITGNIVNLNNINEDSNKIVSKENGVYLTNTTTSNKYFEEINTEETFEVNIDNIFVPDGKFGIFIKSSNPNHDYLIESNPLYTNYGSFISSDYMISRLNINPTDIIKRLGDAMYETNFIRDLIIKSTGNRYLDGFNSDQTQFQALMDNAISLQEDLNLSFGISLSKEQIALLSKDIVWMEKKVVSGETVLVPRLYLASKKLSSDGSKILANSINLNITNNIENHGNISAQNNLTIDANNITNQDGTIQSLGNMQLFATKDINNLSGTIKSQNDLTIKAGGNINNKTSSKQIINQYERGREEVTQRGKTAKIISNANIDIQANENITLENANITAQDDIFLVSNNADININSLESKSSYDFNFSNGYSKGANSTNLESNIEGKNISLDANNIKIKSSNIKADESIIFNSKKNIEVLANNDVNYSDMQISSSNGFMGTSVKKDMLYEEKLISSNLTAKDIILKSQNDINIISSKLDTVANIEIKAANELLISSANEYLLEEKWTKESKFNIAGLLNFVGIDAGAIYEMNYKKNANTQTTAKSSQISAGKDIILNAGNAKIVGSNLNANENIIATTDVGSLEILSAKQTQTKQSFDKNIQIKLSSLSDIVTSVSGIGQNLDDSKLKISLAKATYDKVDTSKNSVTNKSSNITSQSNIVFDSVEDITVEGSNIEAKDDISFNALQNINIKESINSEQSTTKETHAKAEVNLTLQNEYVEVAKAYDAVLEATKKVKQARREYKKYKNDVKTLENRLAYLQTQYENKTVGIDKNDLTELSQIISDIKTDEKYYLASIAASVLNLVSKQTLAAQQTVAASSSHATAGFSAGLSLDLEGSKTKTNSSSKTAIASNIKANNITLLTNTNANNQTNIAGSNLQATNDLNIVTKDLNIISSLNTYNANSDSKDISGSVSMTMYGATSGPHFDFGYGEQNSRFDNISNNNSKLKANNINILTSNDANFKGANVVANSYLNLTVGNDLNIESKKDVQNSASNAFNISSGIGFNNSKITSAKGSYGANNSRVKSKQTLLSSVTADKINANVGNNTKLYGSLLAAGSYDQNGNFVDNNNLTLDTNTLTYRDISNTVYNSGKSFNLGANIDISKNAKISSSLQYANNSSYIKNKTLSTLGKGNINISDNKNSDDTTSLNRDTSKLNKDLFETKQNINIDATLDHRLLSEVGRDEIKEDFKITGKEIQKIDEILPSEENPNEVLATVGQGLNFIGDISGGIIPSDKNNGGLISQTPVLFGQPDDAHKIEGDSNSKNVFMNGIMTTNIQAQISADNIIGKNKDKQVWLNPTHGFIGDLLESAVDKVGGQSGISYQAELFLKNNTDLKIYMHSQGNLVAMYGALSSIENRHEFLSYGAPMSDKLIRSVFTTKPYKNEGDYVAYPLNIFNSSTWNKPGHGTENYGASKILKEKQRLNSE